MNRPCENGASDGFTLLEMIVAFLILSISMAVALQTVSIASRSIALAREKRGAIDLVSELEAERLPGILAGNKLSDTGNKDGIRWEISVSPTNANESANRLQGLALIRIYPVELKDTHYDFAVFASGKAK